MNIILQDTEWNKCTEQEQQNILEIYNKHPEWLDVINALEDKFGKHNLQPEPKIKTWKDLEKSGVEVYSSWGKLGADITATRPSEKIINKCIATLKIAKLFEFGYGGMVSNEEWEDNTCLKYYIVLEINKGRDRVMKPSIQCNYEADEKHFIAFHTKQQAEEFMSYNDNRKLIEQYYMI